MRRHLTCHLNGITQPRVWCTDTKSLTWQARDYVSIHQSPSLCNAIRIPGPCLLAIISLDISSAAILQILEYIIIRLVATTERWPTYVFDFAWKRRFWTITWAAHVQTRCVWWSSMRCIGDSSVSYHYEEHLNKSLWIFIQLLVWFLNN